MSIVKLGYVELAVHDLCAAREFYVDTLGFIETCAQDNALYLRGVDDRNHHCLILREQSIAPQLNYFSWRVDTDAALDELAERFRAEGREVKNIEAGEKPGLGRAIRLIDPCGHPVEFYHEMEWVDSYARRSHLWRGAAPRRLDHVATTTPDVQAAQRYYEGFGFHTAEYAETPEGDDVFLAFMHVTSHDHDIAFVKKDSANLQHASFWMDNWHDIIHATDVVADAGYKAHIEFGPGRHKATNAFFVYLFDPSGNRIEFFSGGSWIPDKDAPAIRWDFETYIAEGRLSWGDKAPESFRTQMSPAAKLE